jgi:DNA topoisomerase-1
VLAEKKYVQKMREYYKTGAGQEPKPPKPLKDDAKPIAAPKDVAACNKRLDAIDAKLKKMNFERSEREENKTIALSTSKLNYMDPRITAAFCKRVGLPIEKVFAKTLRQSFLGHSTSSQIGNFSTNHCRQMQILLLMEK